ncbi:MAG: hypothetical protein AAGJ70_05460 [Pseudomonadota bacterium]
MYKIVMLFFAGVACIQMIRPLGWRGLERRQDAWKLAAAGMAFMLVTVLFTAGLKTGA